VYKDDIHCTASGIERVRKCGRLVEDPGGRKSMMAKSVLLHGRKRGKGTD